MPSQRVRWTYEQWLGFAGQRLLMFGVQRWNPAQSSRSVQPAKESHFESLRLVLVGAAGSGNKGHLWLLQLLEAALSNVPNDARA